MTLIVGRVTPIGVRVAGDMRISNPNATRSGFFDAQLKVILLRPTLCVAYAGNVGAALSAIRKVASEEVDVATAEGRLLEAHVQSDLKVDFLVGSLRPSRLVAIKDGRAQVREADWLGDSEAFAEYQRIYFDPGHFQPPREFYESEARWRDMEVASRMGAGMEAVVYGAGYYTEGGKAVVKIPEGGAHATVGEAIMTAQPRAEDDLFAYSEQRRMIAPPFVEAPPGHEGFFDPGFGSAERGSFSYSVLTTVQPGLGAVGIYFPEGRVGFLHAPLLLDEPERYSTVSEEQFVELVRLRRGVRLKGLGIGIQIGPVST